MRGTIRVTKKPKSGSAGTVVAGIIAVIIYNTTGHITWQLVLGLIFVMVLVDVLVYRPPRSPMKERLEIVDEI